jgi:hypothetical protein
MTWGVAPRRAAILAVAVAAAAIARPGPVARAQPASALGQPLPKGDLPTGTVTVRVVAGERSRPVAGTDVRLTVNGALRVAVTDAGGLATFAGLPPGARVTAQIDGATEAVESEEFAVPTEGGAAVMLSTEPWVGAADHAAGQPEPRQMAGQARAQLGDPAGRVTVRLVYNDLQATDPFGDVPVTMVAYAADGRIAARTLRTGGDGRAVFDSLDTTGNTAYYALAALPRGDGHDRLSSLPIVPGPELGVRVMLSAEKLGSNAPPVDDLGRFFRQPTLPPGHVVVTFGGEVPHKGKVELLDATTGGVVASAAIGRAGPLPGSVSAEIGEPVADPAIAAGTVQGRVEVAIGGHRIPRPSAPTLIRSVATDDPFERAGASDRDGQVTLDGAPAGVPLELVIDVQGSVYTSAPFELAAHGVSIPITASFDVLGTFEARFEGVAPTAENGYLVQVKHDGELYRSMPFQALPERGVVVPIFIGPRIALGFRLDAFVDDEYLAVRGDFTIQNLSWAPWAGPSEGLRLPAPRGATGLGVADEHQHWVAVDGSSFRLIRPVPPFAGQFRAGFSIKSDGGAVHWDWPLPLGATGSTLAIRMSPRMTVKLPPGASGRTIKERGMTWFAIGGVEIAPRQRMVFDVHGMPERPAWHWVAKVIVGVASILLIGIGAVFATGRGQKGSLIWSPAAVALLSLFTLGIYGIVWKIVTARALRHKLGASIPPSWLVVVPLVNLYWLWRYAEAAERPSRMAPITTFGLLWLVSPIGMAILAHRMAPTLWNPEADAVAEPPSRTRRRRIEDLLDQVAAIDQARAASDAAPDPAERDALVAELEALYRQERP